MPAPIVRETPRPALIPVGPISQAQTEQLWGRDRAALLSCAAEKGAALDFYDQLAAGLRGNP